MPYIVIGNGSKIIFSDNDFEGLLIKNRSESIVFDLAKSRVIADSGVSLSRLALETASRGLGGLEPFFNSSDTVGGAIIKNEGAAGVSISDLLVSSSIMVSTEKILNCRRAWFKFSYRQSRLKNSKSQSAPVLLNGIFQLHQKKKEDILEGISQSKKQLKADKHNEFIIRNVFINPSESDFGEKEQTVEFLLSQIKANRMLVGDAAVSKNNLNDIINTGTATSFEVRELIEKMRGSVNERFGIILRENIEYFGNFNAKKK